MTSFEASMKFDKSLTSLVDDQELFQDIFQVISHPLQRYIDDDKSRSFPLILSPTTTTTTTTTSKIEHPLTTWLASHHKDLDELLTSHRAILFRGFSELQDYQDFHRFVIAMGYQSMPYVGGAAVRTALTERVFTANESPPTEVIPFHHELAQTPQPPTHIFFFCEQPPSSGGETPLLVSNEIYQRLKLFHPKTMEKIERLGVQYIRIISREDDPSSAIGRGWKSTFQCETKEEAESALKALGSSWEWLEDDNLKTITSVLPAVRVDNEGPHRSGTISFYNSIVAAYLGWNDRRNEGKRAIMTSDGETLDPSFMEDAARLMEEICVAIPWQKGDAIVVDNRLVMHARRTFTGPRRILAAIGRDPAR